jgi:pyocin large subunit-like protein
MTKFEDLLLKGGNWSNTKDPIYRERAAEMAKEYAEEQDKLIEAMEDEKKAKEKAIRELEDLAPKDTTSLDPTDGILASNSWVSQLHNNKARLFFLHHDLRIAELTKNEYFTEMNDLGFNAPEPYTGEDPEEGQDRVDPI